MQQTSSYSDPHPRRRGNLKPTPARCALFPSAVSLRAASLLFEGDGRPAFYICADDHGGLPHLYRVPDGVQITVKAPRLLPEGVGRVFLPVGSRVTFQAEDGRVSVLALHAVRVCRELLEALEAYGQATRQGAA